MIHALEHATNGEREAITTVLEEQAFSTVRYEAILETLGRHHSVDYAMRQAMEHAEAAKASLEELPETEYFVVSRDR